MNVVYADSKITVVTTYKWEPFNMINSNRLEGIGIDFWKLVAKKAGINYKFKVVEKWSDVLNEIKNSNAALTVSTDETEDRKSYAVFSKAYVTYPLVIATKNSIGFIFDIEYLKNKKIAVGRNYTAAKMMYSRYPYLDYVYVNNTDEALNMVKEDKAFAAIDILPVIAYKINKYEFKDLKISGQIPIDFKVRFMLSKKYSYLLSKINSAIEKISYEEKEKIYQKYINPKTKLFFTSNEILFYFLILTSFLIIILLWVYTLIYELKDLKKQRHNNYYTDCDRLTGIFNRKTAIDIIKRKTGNNEKFSLIMFDINNFKNINRFYGHQFGDITLLELVSSVKSFLKKDEVFARIRGGTFLIILNETENDACKRAKNIQDSIKKFDFSIVKDIRCTFVVKTIYFPNGGAEDIVCKLENELKKSKRNSQLFRC
ncbi:diguanylate cyclase domain-containing protein [Nautilia profundicola]|uniref:transporter substrate-binding domain-containing diguanylate cyclase n=1 Tax=Nautilia profundicola TaxID=244787 RepID=UPI00117CD360|nr:transporter substrate-binding domain-containing protein [Nautilia profundicola]